MTVLLLFFFFFSTILLFFNLIKVRFLPTFLIINLTVIINLVLGGYLTKLFLGTSFVQPGVDMFILSSIFVPGFIFIIIYVLFGKIAFNNGYFTSSEITDFKNWATVLFGFSRLVFIIFFSFNLLIMINKGLYFRDFYRYIIENNLGLQLTLTYTSGLFTLFY